MAELHEECGVFGIYSPTVQPLGSLTYYGLFALQHRGQESCGIVVSSDGLFTARKDLGLLTDVFDRESLENTPRAIFPWAMCATAPPAAPTGPTASPSK